MKTFATVLALLALFALVPAAPCTAEAPSEAPDVAEFLATLSADPGNSLDIEGLTPALKFLSTVCTSNADCPTGQLCCYPCGIDGCDWVCMEVQRNRCPPIA